MQKSNNLNPHVSVDCVIFGFDGEHLQVLLIKRDIKTAVLALPGDLIRDDEDLDQAASRILFELTGLKDIFLRQLRSFGDPGRIRDFTDVQWLKNIREEPNARVITIAYYSLVKSRKVTPKPSSFAHEVTWQAVYDLPKLAFDHNLIVGVALNQLRNNFQKEPVFSYELLPKKFTLGALQKLYEAILGKSIDKRNFRKKIKSAKILLPLDEKQQDVAHKPARFYQFDRYKIKKKNWI